MGALVGGDAGGTAIGMAPDARWIAVKIFNDRGTATSAGIHLGYQWLLDPDGNPATADSPNVVDNSWTSASPGACSAEFQPDLRSLRAAGMLPVFAAGNYGPSAGTSASPANLPEALSVGVVNNSGVVDGSSSRGPSACGQTVYPQLVAPGVGVRTTDLYGGFVNQTGSSMAAPHAAGALALLLNAFPGLSVDRQAAALQNSAVDLGVAGPDNTYGYGRLDAVAAYNRVLTSPDFTVSASPSSLSASAGGTATSTVSMDGVNGFAGAVTLSLSGLTASQATWALSPATIPSPTGTSQLSITTASALGPGSYPLTITGTSGSLTRSAAATLVVSGPDFFLAMAPSSISLSRGRSASYRVTVSAPAGFTGSVSLSVSGLPSGATATLSPNPVAGAGTSTLFIRTTTSAARGTFVVRVAGSSGALSHQASATLTVT
jgi:hypothetical protein